MMPKRIQRKRTKGWRMPAGAIYAGRPTKWGNPYDIRTYGRDLALRNFRRRVDGILAIDPKRFEPLRGKNLACWCSLEESCHVDILLEVANAQPR